METKQVFELVCEDASHLGGPMGTEYTTVMWTEFFTSRKAAIAYADKKYPHRESWDKWTTEGSQSYRDAGSVILTVKPKTLKIR